MTQLTKEGQFRTRITQPSTMAEREMLSFVDSVVNLFGSECAKFLADIWLEELAAMDRTPEPMSSEWRLVSLFASARLASRLMGLQRHPASFELMEENDVLGKGSLLSLE